MSCYPLPIQYRRGKNQKSGSFLEKRTDRIHCGIDLYAPKKTEVFAVENGTIHSISEFTNPNQIPYWNITYEIILHAESTYYFRYAELDEVFVKKNDSVSEGDVIASVGQVLNPDKIDEHQPHYIQQLAKDGKLSMLHFEMYDQAPERSKDYLGGNWFTKDKPRGLCDPTSFLTHI